MADPLNLQHLTRNQRYAAVGATATVVIAIATLLALRNRSASTTAGSTTAAGPSFTDLSSALAAQTAAGAAAAGTGEQAGAALAGSAYSAAADIANNAVQASSGVAQTLAQSQAQLGAAGMGLASSLGSQLGAVAATAVQIPATMAPDQTSAILQAQQAAAAAAASAAAAQAAAQAAAAAKQAQPASSSISPARQAAIVKDQQYIANDMAALAKNPNNITALESLHTYQARVQQYQSGA